MTTPHEALTSKLQTIVDAQLKLRWTPPALAKSLQVAVANVAKVGATMKLSTAAGNGSAPKAGHPTDALSLGVGVSVSAAAKISAGISLGIGFSATASLLTQLNVGLNTAVSRANDLERELATFNAAAKLKAGTNGVMPPGQRIEQQPVNSALRGLNEQIADCQAKATAAAPGEPTHPISAELEHPRVGAWECSLDLDVETPPTGKIKFRLDDLDFTGTVLPDQTGMDGSRGRCRVVAGNGHLTRVLNARSYSGGAGIKVGAIVRDILHECGEDLSDLSDGPTLDKTLPRWHAVSGTAQQQLTALAEQVDAAWRVLRDGTVWFGTETWPEVAPDGVLTSETWSSGHLTLAPETPNMVPGTVYQGQKIEHVSHSYGEKLRTHIRTQSGNPIGALGALAKHRQQIDYSREYPCKVVTQNPDGTLQLLPDDEVMKASGLDHVAIRYGMPGFKAIVKTGARCHLAFAAGDPTRPFVGSWEYDPDKVTLISAFDGARSFARVGDIVQGGGPGTVCTLFPLLPVPGVGTAPNNAISAGVPCLISFSAVPLTPATLQLQAPLFSAIAGGIDKFQG